MTGGEIGVPTGSITSPPFASSPVSRHSRAAGPVTVSPLSSACSRRMSPSQPAGT